jgi:hypothetical protein
MDPMVPFFEQPGIPLSRVLTDCGTEYCGAPDRHPYELYLQICLAREHAGFTSEAGARSARVLHRLSDQVLAITRQ